MEPLGRPFGLWTATAMVVGGMIGAGIFVLPASLAPFGWTSAGAWIAAGLGVLAIGRVIAELTLRRPEEPSILTHCGDVLGLLAGRMIAWSYWMTIVCSVPVLAMAATAYLLHLAPQVPATPANGALGGTLIVVLLALINLRGVRDAGRLQVVTTALKLIPLVVVIAIVGWLLLREPQTFASSQSAPFRWTGLTPALGLAFFAMLSFENASMMAERVRDPARNVVRATLFGLSLVLVIYFVVSTGIVAAMPVDQLSGSSAPVALFVERRLGGWAGDWVALFAAISAIGCLNGLVLLLGELPLGMARDGQLPAWMAPANSRDVASRPLVLGCALGIALMLVSTNAAGERVLDFMLRLTTASAIWFYLGVCLTAIMTRVLQPLAWLGAGFCLWVLYGTGLEAGLLGFVFMLFAIPLHFLIGERTRPRYSAPA